jgi:hypothetical protein
MTGHNSIHLSSQLHRDAQIGKAVSQGIKRDLISKITTIKRVGGVAQVGQHLPNKHEVLNSTPRTAKKKYPQI